MSAALRPAILMRAFAALLIPALLAGPAPAQTPPNPAAKPAAAAPAKPAPAKPAPAKPAPAKPAAQPAAAQPAPEPALPKTYSRPDLVESARRLQALVDRDRAPLEKPAAQLRRDADTALQSGDARTAADLYAKLARLSPDDAGLWMRLSRALSRIKPNEDESADTFLDRATAAAFLAYRKASLRNTQADALYAIGHLYADRSLDRAALDTLNLALAVRDVPAERAFYDKLRAEKGFRMLDYTVDSDAASPRACVQFSEDLAKGPVDFATFVALSGPGGAVDKPAVSVDDSQLCVEGLRHGEAYDLTLRAGLPSVIAAEKLQAAAELTIYVRDRKPGVRFTGRAYVLPATGPRSIPVVTVNTSRVAVEVLRVSDRSLIPTALDGDFRRDLGSYDLSQLKDGQAEVVFRGELETASPLNEDTTTGFPVDEAIGALKPGIYVLAARPAGDAANPDDDYATRSAQWFIVSDLGMTALSGADGLHVLVRALGTAKPVANAEIRLLAKSNELLATARTDASGTAVFDAAITRGSDGLAPAVAVARGEAQGGGDDYAFLSLADQAFDLTDRGVGGRAAPGRIDAFVTTERGVYRSGETVRLTALLRDPQVAAVTGVPLTFVLKRPDGVEDRRALVDDQGAGGRAAAFDLMAGAMTGTWRVDAYVDPRGAPVGSTTFLVEDYVPERLALELSSTARQIAAGTPVTVDVQGRWLFGPPAVGLDISGEIELRVARERAGWPGWRFGRGDDGFTAVREPLPDSRLTDKDGKASLAATLPAAQATGQPLETEIFVALEEGGGRAIRRSLTLPVTPSGPGLGVKPLWSGSGPAEGTSAAVEVALVDAAGKQLPAAGVSWVLYRVENRYQWYRVGNEWNFEPVQATRKVADGTLDLAADTPARLETPVEWGRYRLEVTSGAGANRLSTAVTFEAGWGGGATADAPDRLDLTLDKPHYAEGDRLNVHITSRTAGSATVLIVGDGVLASRTLDVPAGDSTVSFDVAAGWAPGAYALALLHRPLDVAAGRNPGRAIGLAWFGVDHAERILQVALDAPARIRPETTLSVPVEVKGAAVGEAYVTLALVDVGILNLTGFKAPSPDGFYLGQRQLGTEVRDFYGQLIDGMQGARGRLRSGGDAMDEGLQADPPTQPPLALFSGPVKLDGQGRATIDFAVPAFDGTGKLMAVAWSAGAVGHGEKDVVIRDPVVATTTLPRFLGAGDRSTLNLALDNVDGPAGDYSLSLITDGPVKLGAAPATLTLAQGTRQSLQVPLQGTGIGPAKVSVRLGGPEGLSIQRDYALEIRPAYPAISRRTITSLPPGATMTLSGDLVADLVPGTGRVTVSAGGDPAFDVPALMAALDRYPFACSEQLTSRALPLLYSAELAKGIDLKNDPDRTIRDAISRLVARQGSDGSFGLWQAGGNDLFLDAYVTDFLTRARERGFAVPEVPFRLALDQLRNALSLAGDEGATDDGDAYAMYVLARNGRAPLGDLRYVADAKMEDVTSAFARGNIAAALGLLGDKGRAETAFKAALELLPEQPEVDLLGRADFGSELRDAAGVATLAAEGGFPGPAAIARARATAVGSEAGPTSTQEDAWLLLAARAAREARGVTLEIDGAAHAGLYERVFEPAVLTVHPTSLANRGTAPVAVAVSIDGPPASPEPAAAQGFALTRSYFDLAGNPVDPAKVQQNQRLVVVLEAQEDEYAPSQVLLVDWLPAGFEIDNPALAVGSDAGALSWLGETTEAAHAEFRDTHFMAAFDRNQDSEEPELLRVAYIVRAVSPGTYAHPPAIVEDMYRPGRFARTAAGTTVVTERGK